MVRASAKRAIDVAGFINKFKPKMKCATINPKHTQTGLLKNEAMVLEDGSIIMKNDENRNRDFMVEVIEAPSDLQKKIVESLYKETQIIILLVRDRLEREKTLEIFVMTEDEAE